MFFKKSVALFFCIAASASAMPSIQQRDLPSGNQVGKATSFTPGAGVCGTSAATDRIAAVPASIFGTAAANSPVCGKQITVSSGGKSVTIPVEDICSGCSGTDVALSTAAFTVLADPSANKIDITWSAA